MLNQPTYSFHKPSLGYLEGLKAFTELSVLRNLKKGDFLIRQGEISSGFIQIISGSAYVELTNSEGESRVLTILGEGEWLGEGAIIRRPSQVTVSAREPLIYRVLSQPKLDHWLSMHPKFMRYILDMVLERQQLGNAKTMSLANDEAESKVLHTLNQLANSKFGVSHPDGREVRLSRIELGKIAGCSRETVGKVLTRLAEQGRIQSTKGKSHIVAHPSSDQNAKSQTA